MKTIIFRSYCIFFLFLLIGCQQEAIKQPPPSIDINIKNKDSVQVPNIEVLVVEHAKENRPHNEMITTIGITNDKGLVTWSNPSLGKHELILKNDLYSQSLKLEIKSSSTVSYTFTWKH